MILPCRNLLSEGRNRRNGRNITSASRLNGAGGQESATLVQNIQIESVSLTIEMGEPVTSRGFKHINTVDVKVFLTGMENDPREAVAQHTGQGAHEQDGTQCNEDEHERRSWSDIVSQSREVTMTGACQYRI